MRVIAVTRTGNALGLSAAELAATPPEPLAARLAVAEAEFRAAGAERCLGGVAELPALLCSGLFD